MYSCRILKAFWNIEHNLILILTKFSPLICLWANLIVEMALRTSQHIVVSLVMLLKLIFKDGHMVLPPAFLLFHLVLYKISKVCGFSFFFR